MVSGKWKQNTKGNIIVNLGQNLALLISKTETREEPHVPLIRVVGAVPHREGWTFGNAAFFVPEDWKILCETLLKLAE